MLLSATRITTYRTCPRQYRYRYVDGLPTLMTVQMAFGRVIHDTLGEMHRRCVESNRPLEIDHGLGEFRRRWQDIIESEGSVFESSDQAASEYPKLAESILRGFVEDFRVRILPLAVEFPFAVRWGDETLIGFVDRIDETDDGIEIVEFKTGKRKPCRREVDEDLQLLLYTYGVGETLGLPVRRAVYHHLRSGSSLPTERGRHVCAQQVDDILSRVVPAIQAGRHPPRNGWWCRFCDYRQICETEGPVEMLLPPAPLCVSATRKGVDTWPQQQP